MTKNQKILLFGGIGCLIAAVIALCCFSIYLVLNVNSSNVVMSRSVCVAGGGTWTVAGCVSGSTKTITTYEECVAAGYPVLESYPARCITPDGKSFTQPVKGMPAVPPDETTSAPAPTPTPVTEPTPVPAATGVKVYFSKNPDSSNDFTYTQSVNRSTTRTDVGTYAIEQLIAGPSASEAAGGVFTPVKLSGTSNCSGKDFSLSINQATKKATLKFCRDVTSAGIGDDARIKTTISSTLTQFSTVTSVVILTKDGHCFGDGSGMDVCLM